MKKIFAIFYLICCVQFGFSQFDIDWVLPFENGLSVYESLELPDQSIVLKMGSEYLISDTVKEPDHYGGFDMWIGRYDKNGNLVWLNIFGSSEQELLLSMKLDTDNSIIFTGYSRGDDHDLIPTEQYQKGWFFKINLDGNLLWSNVFTSKNLGGDEGFKFAPYFNQKDMIHGKKYLIDSVGNELGFQNWWLDINKDSGEILDTIYEQKIYENEQIYSIKKVDDGFLIETAVSSSSQYYNERHPFRLLKLDDDLNPVFFKVFYSDEVDRGLDMSVDNVIEWNDKYYFIGQNYLWSHVWSGELEIICMEKNGDVLWRKTFDNTYFPDRIKPFIFGDQLVVVIASTSTNLFGPNFIEETYGDNSRDIIILGFDEEGNNTWQQNFGGSENEAIYGVTKTLDNGLIINGVTESSDIDFEGMNEDNKYIDFVMKLFPMNSTFERDHCIDFTIVPNPIEEDEINIHFDVIFDRIADIIVTDILGRVILSLKNYNIHDNEYVITLPNGTSKGVYFVTIRCGNDLISQKVIKLDQP